MIPINKNKLNELKTIIEKIEELNTILSEYAPYITRAKELGVIEESHIMDESHCYNASRLMIEPQGQDASHKQDKTLKTHMKSHGGSETQYVRALSKDERENKEFICEICGKSFGKRTQLSAHLSSHKNLVKEAKIIEEYKGFYNWLIKTKKLTGARALSLIKSLYYEKIGVKRYEYNLTHAKKYFNEFKNKKVDTSQLLSETQEIDASQSFSETHSSCASQQRGETHGSFAPPYTSLRPKTNPRAEIRVFEENGKTRLEWWVAGRRTEEVTIFDVWELYYIMKEGMAKNGVLTYNKFSKTLCRHINGMNTNRVSLIFNFIGVDPRFDCEMQLRKITLPLRDEDEWCIIFNRDTQVKHTPEHTPEEIRRYWSDLLG